jgi:hypothetical protein
VTSNHQEELPGLENRMFFVFFCMIGGLKQAECVSSPTAIDILPAKKFGISLSSKTLGRQQPMRFH